MTFDPSNPEAELRKLRAAPLDEDLLLRLEACAEGTFTQLTAEELCFEAKMRESRPARLDPAMLADLDRIFAAVPFPIDEKIVLFPKANNASSAAPPKRQRPLWAAAAAVALVGAATALLIPTTSPQDSRFAGHGGTPGATQSRSSDIATAAPFNSPNQVIPASFNRGVSEVNDEGIVWKGDNQPHNVVRVVYNDKITMKDKDGRSYQVEQPRVQYVLIPARTD